MKLLAIISVGVAIFAHVGMLDFDVTELDADQALAVKKGREACAEDAECETRVCKEEAYSVNA